MNNKNILIFVIALTFVTFFSNVFGLENYQGQVNMTFNPQPINITSPLSITYSFLLSADAKINLSANSHFPLTNWNYILTNLKRNTISTQNIATTNNTYIFKEISVLDGQNKLEVRGTDINGQIHNTSVYFTVNLSNTAPVIENISEEIFVCENTALNYFFTSYDADEETIYVDITPKSPFYIRPFMRVGTTRLVSEIYSGTLRKIRIGKYVETVSINDGRLSDYRNINITVIEVNNAPVIENIGVQTIWLAGEGTEFNKTIVVSDTENGLNSSNFNLTIVFEGTTLFDISSDGKMYLKAKQEDLGVHNITVCAEDTQLTNIHPNISICSQNGSSIKTCSNFSLTVTNVNRQPTIIDHEPNLDSVNISGTSTTHFSISKYDPDLTIPDSYWYLDDKLINYFSGRSNDSLDYSFGCGINGIHKLKVIITDGALNDSLTWNLNVYANECPAIISAGGGGGGGGASCIPKLACEEWYTCQNAKKTLAAGILSGENYRHISKLCEEKYYDENTCGFQLRSCYDLSNCSKTIPSSEILGECFFTANPSCFDGIQNCHDESCETLIDCGGPCSPCPTCSDKIQNQKEDGIDCGGPCPIKCKKKIEKTTQVSSIYDKIIESILTKQAGILTVITLLLAIIIYIARRIYLIRKEKRRLVYKYFRNENE